MFKLAFFLIFLLSCQTNSSGKSSTQSYTNLINMDTLNYLHVAYKNNQHESDSIFCFVNSKGDTIIPFGRYGYCWTDTLKTFAIVFDKKTSKVIAIDQNENVLFDVYMFDNWPDEISEGLFRVKRNDKIGYANKLGEIIISCQFECAFPFKNGRAKVAYKCRETQTGEHKTPKSSNWIYIDKMGYEIEKNN